MKIYDLIKTSILLIRPDILFLAMGLLLFGSLLTHANSIETLLFILLGGVGLFGAAGSLDEYGDYDLDIKNKKNRFLSSLHKTKISRRHAITQATLLYSFANIGLYLLFGAYALTIGLILTLITVLYSFSVFDLKRRGVPRLLTNAISLTLLFMLPAISQNDLSVTISLWGILIFLSLLAPLLCNDLKDFPIENKERMKTLSVKFGIQRLSKIILLFSFFALFILLAYISVGVIEEIYVMAILVSLVMKLYYVPLLLKPTQVYLKKIALGAIADSTFFMFFLSFLTILTFS